MNQSPRKGRSFVLLGLLVAAGPCLARQQWTYDFEDLAVGTAVTTQYDGVTISAAPQSCSGLPALFMRIGTPSGGTSSGTRALGIDTGCPDFSPDYLRMVFENLQTNVSFTVGDLAATYVVRVYSDAGLIQTRNIVVEGTGSVGVHRIVHVSIAAGTIRRIEVEASPSGNFEWIDDLTFDLDRTPPIAILSAPEPISCNYGIITLRGTADDPDGTYLRDTAEYKPVDGDWTVIGTATSPQPNGALYNWNTGALAEGFYFVRLTVWNKVGLSASDSTTLWISRNFDTVSFDLPGIVGGMVHPDGTVWDSYCTGQYTVEYSRTAPISYGPVDPAHPSYAGYVANNPLAEWQTVTLADGNYLVRVRGTNLCGQSTELVDSVVLDNTPPAAVITSPQACDTVQGIVQVRGTATDVHLGGWSLSYTGGDQHGWAPIASGIGPVANGPLGNFDTRSLRRCAYALRLVVTDRASVDDGVRHNQSEYLVTVTTGCDADFNADGLVNSQDFFDFLAAFFAGCG